MERQPREYLKGYSDCLREKVTPLEQQNKDLKQYARHHKGCDLGGFACTCGLDKLLKV